MDAPGPSDAFTGKQWPEPGQLCLQQAHRLSGATLVIQDPDVYRENDIHKLVSNFDLDKFLEGKAARACQAAKPRVVFNEETNKAAKADPLLVQAADISLHWPENGPRSTARNKSINSRILSKVAIDASNAVLSQSNADLVKGLCAAAAVLGSKKTDVGSKKIDECLEFEALAVADGRHVSHVVASLQILYGTKLSIDRVARLYD